MRSVHYKRQNIFGSENFWFHLFFFIFWSRGKRPAKKVAKGSTGSALNIDSSLMTLTIFGLTLHSWLFIEIQINEFTLVKVDKNANPIKRLLYTLFNKLNIFITLCHFFVNVQYVINFNSIIMNTKIISITIKSSSFHIIYWPVFWNVS